MFMPVAADACFAYLWVFYFVLKTKNPAVTAGFFVFNTYII